jgi:acetyl/propionyl-CoA carboxylase alpha subunit
MSDGPPFRRVLVANRGEIAVRICRGLRELGVESVAVHSEADRRGAHVQNADHAVPLGGNSAAESYLDTGKILAAAKALDVEAIHPGYGFLSENPAFAQAVRDAGFTFIGPNARAMERLGSKKSAREAAVAAGVPVVPGTEQDSGDAGLIEVARRIGLPVMVKASAGGGGRGMRLVRSPREMETTLPLARSEARAAFGDDSLYFERWIEDNRHVEVQVLVDSYGNGIHLGERDCSVQRRHQKII